MYIITKSHSQYSTKRKLTIVNYMYSSVKFTIMKKIQKNLGVIQEKESFWDTTKIHMDRVGPIKESLHMATGTYSPYLTISYVTGGYFFFF